MHIVIWPSSGIKTLRDTRSAVGRFRDNTGFGLVHPTGEQRTWRFTWKSPRFDADAYKKLTVEN
ncbi:hypothetical protein RIB2604_03502150 [Aspergillus luchuensis]|uniref:Uncharacterized protein n=1 Tax=Aspergillus kawachii TaxID=1069201 RepID=A0A146FZ32_ASPKA|nr:hypothetical protein RIB2604_03502150 [Aspergillus luchuensis]